ncbi:hypothetical protein F444_00548 [Phytophthora nicotianae P1976]|uniref:Uncharacterized protein n=1 Tax=Phytophthora nicotianae P1976 TaxID=1317066 RepID=A0A081B3X6_PHYNI|nr:hypothetical protein F444_00548 [Phytophthora nicotianae P1976]
MHTQQCFDSQSKIEITAISEFIHSIDADLAAASDTQWREASQMNCSPHLSPDKPVAVRSDARVSYSTELQRRKRNEALALRTQVKELKARLAQLKRKRQAHLENALALSSGTHREGTIRWRSIAVMACEVRQLAERSNRELKQIVESQDKVRASILRLLAKTNAICEVDMHFVRKAQPRVDVPLFLPDFVDTIKQRLSSRLKSLHVKLMFPQADSSTVVSYRYQTVPFGHLGNRVDISSTTPMSCSVQETGDLLWSFTTANSMKSASSVDYVAKKTAGPLDMTCVSSLREGPQLLHTISVFRRFNEGDQIVLMGAAMWFLPGAGLVLQDYNWTVISPTQTYPEYRSVVRNCYNLEETIVSPATTQTQKTILDLVGNRMRIITQEMQDTLLSEGDSSFTS